MQWAGAESYSFAICSTTLLADFDLATACHQRYITPSWCYALLFSCYVVPRWQHYITRPNAMLRIDMLFSCNMFHRQHFIIPNNSLELFKLLRLFQTLFQPAGRRGEPILTGWHNLNKAALEDCSNHVSHDGTLHWLACNTSCILELCMTLFWHGVHVYMIMHTRVMYDTGSISSAADLLCCSQTQQSAIHSERDCSIKHPGKYFLYVAAEN